MLHNHKFSGPLLHRMVRRGVKEGCIWGINEHTSLCDRLVATGPGWACGSKRKLIVEEHSDCPVYLAVNDGILLNSPSPNTITVVTSLHFRFRITHNLSSNLNYVFISYPIYIHLHLISLTVLFIQPHTNFGNIFSLDASKSTVEQGFRDKNINKTAESYMNILRVLLHSVPLSLLFISEPKIQL